MSDDYRYSLSRDIHTEVKRGTVTWVMLNPSTADENVNDPTIRKCIGFTDRWGYSSLLVVNLWPVRATKPADMLNHPKPDGLYARQRITMGDALRRADLVVFAWGGNKDKADRLGLEPYADPAEMLDYQRGQAMCLGTTKSGQPRHPLMLAYTTPLEEWKP